jgi:hypothetical protein
MECNAVGRICDIHGRASIFESKGPERGKATSLLIGNFKLYSWFPLFAVFYCCNIIASSGSLNRTAKVQEVAYFG